MHPADIAAALKRAGYTQKEVGDACGVGRGVANAVIRGVGRSKRVEEKIAELTGLSLGQLWPDWYQEARMERGTGAAYGVDPQRLALICHAIEAAVDESLRVKGHCSPRVLGLIYNQVLAKGRSSDDDVELAKAEVAQFLESLRALDIPDTQLAERILRQPSEPRKGISVSGSGNQVAGGNLSGTQINIGTKK
jgi:lambda repressor-like predicted transcriptional regulator